MKIQKLFLTLTMMVLFVASCVQTTVSAESKPRRIEIAAKRFQYSPSEVSLKKGEPVVLVFTSSDVTHGLRIRELNLETKIPKGKFVELAFTPYLAGDFVGHCAAFCGPGHGSMIFTLHVSE